MRAPGVICSFIDGATAKLEGVERGLACEGTSLESTTWNAKQKAFAFAGLSKGVVSLRFKLKASAAAAKKQGVTVGANGWATLKLDEGAKPPAALAKWIRESYALVTAG